MKDIGLLSDYNTSYQFNAYYDKDNKSKTYLYFIENEKEIKHYCEINQVNIYQVTYSFNNQERELNSSNEFNTIGDTCKANSLELAFDNKAVRFDSDLRLFKPFNWTERDMEEYLTEQLYINYPQLAHYQSIADLINNTYYKDYPELSLRFKPTFTWSSRGKKGKFVKGIGIRCTNSLVSAKKDSDEFNSNFRGFYKKDILSRYALNLEYDVTSSVPRVTFLMNTGIWADDDYDFYKAIFDRYETDKSWNKSTRK